MQKDLLLELVKQNQFTSHFSFERVTQKTANLRLNDKTASIGFIYRHIGETMHLFGQFLGIPTDVKNTTMGEIDVGQHHDVSHSRDLIERGYKLLQDLVENSSEAYWLEPVDTPFFWYGFQSKAVRSRAFSHLTSCRTNISDVIESEKFVRGVILSAVRTHGLGGRGLRQDRRFAINVCLNKPNRKHRFEVR